MAKVEKERFPLLLAIIGDIHTCICL